jgi:hypothetical protein
MCISGGSDPGLKSHVLSAPLAQICTQLVANPVVTQCTHVFCRSCYGEWCATQEQQQQQEYQTSASYRCPKCNTGMGSHPAELKTANPLCWRLLCRVQVRCPLHAQGCSWVGDYGESSSHLVNSDSHRASQGSGASEKASAEALKQEGNSQFEIGAFRCVLPLRLPSVVYFQFCLVWSSLKESGLGMAFSSLICEP